MPTYTMIDATLNGQLAKETRNDNNTVVSTEERLASAVSKLKEVQEALLLFIEEMKEVEKELEDKIMIEADGANKKKRTAKTQSNVVDLTHCD